MTTRQRFTFSNHLGYKLSAIIEQPIIPVKYYALFTHCFSCGKDILVASRIARSLSAKGIAVMRFDFMGIGDSEGEFAQSDFTSNIHDIISASDYLREYYEAPKLLIGHSLGATAILNAAEHIPEAKAVVTIAAPSTAEHILSHFEPQVAELEHNENVNINIAGKDLTINKSFVVDVRKHSSTEKISRLRKALLIFHSPIDDIVSIEEATKIFIAAKHPKSFISLDKSDHLISNKEDIEFMAEAIIAWSSRYIGIELVNENKIDMGEVFIGEGNKNFLREIASDDHAWFSDEPTKVGGDNLGPDPYEQLLASLGACTSMTLRMYANHKGWEIDDIQVQLKHSRQHDKDCENIDKNACKLELIEKFIQITGDLNEQQKNRLIEIADRCPVHKTLLGNIKIESNFQYLESIK